MSNYFHRLGYHVRWSPLSSANSMDNVSELITTTTSPQLSVILKHTLLWSDNYDAEYVARVTALKAGFPYSPAGVNSLFQEVLTKANIESPNIKVRDGSGLSNVNRVSAMTLAQALLHIYSDSKYESLIKGLPVGGVSGTLKNRFLKTAPQGVGLVRAKTGTLNGVVNLAGYIDSGSHEYAFVIIADRVRHSHYAEANARAAVDKLLGKIAQPLVLAQTESVPIEKEPTTDVTP